VPERLHKLLAQHGFGSRREIERWMLEGRILLNGKRAQPGDRYQEGDRVEIDGKDVSARLRTASAPRVLIYHKLQGQPIDAKPSEDVKMRSVMESVPSLRGARWLVVNTMQAGDSGLLVLTNDGRLADALRRRAATLPAAYMVRALVSHPDFALERIPRVVQYDDVVVEFDSVEHAGGEGRNRWFLVKSSRAHRRAAVRALFESRGLKVSRVIQIRFADLELPRDLPRGRHRALSDEQVAALYASAGLEWQAPTRDDRRRKRRVPPDRRPGTSGKRPSWPSIGTRKSGR